MTRLIRDLWLIAQVCVILALAIPWWYERHPVAPPATVKIPLWDIFRNQFVICRDGSVPVYARDAGGWSLLCAPTVPR